MRRRLRVAPSSSRSTKRLTSQSHARRIRIVPYTSSVTNARSRCCSRDRLSNGGSARLAYAPSWSTRTSALRAIWRARSALLTQALVGPRPGAVAPVGRRHRRLALRLHLDELEGAVSGADAQVVERTGCKAVGREVGPQNLEPLAAERRPRVAETDHPVDLGCRTPPVDAVFSGIDLVGVRGLALLRRRRAQARAQRLDQQLG